MLFDLSFLTRYSPAVFSILRLVTALLFFEHDTSNHYGWPSPHPLQFTGRSN